MENWKEKITENYKAYLETKSNYHQLIMSVVKELQMSPYNLKANVELVSELPLTWEVTIANKKDKLGLHEIQHAKERFGVAVGNKDMSDEEALKHLLVNKFSWE